MRVPVGGGWSGGRGGGVDGAGGGTGGGVEQSRLFESESSWQQYRKLLPPRCTAPLNAEIQVEKGAGAQGQGGGGSHACKSSKMTLMLDLDKTCLFGNDGNDLGLSLQWMDKSPEVVRELYKLLVSPCLRHAYKNYAAHGDVDVVIYTRRPQLLQYQSCVTGEVVGLRYAPSMHYAGNQVHIPASLRSPEDVLARYCGPKLDEDETHDVLKGLERLLAARDAIAHELGLSTPPHVVVTAREKDVTRTARHLGMDPCNAVLYDDNIVIAHENNVVNVEPLMSLPRAQRDELLSFMNRVLPVEEIDEDLLFYLEEAHPDEQSLRCDTFTGRISWWIPEMPASNLKKWRITDPPQVDAAKASLQAKKTHFNKLPLSASCIELPLQLDDGMISPVSAPGSPPCVEYLWQASHAPRRACTNLESLEALNLDMVWSSFWPCFLGTSHCLLFAICLADRQQERATYCKHAAWWPLGLHFRLHFRTFALS